MSGTLYNLNNKLIKNPGNKCVQGKVENEITITLKNPSL